MRKKNILVVDDEKHLCLAISKTLEKDGFKVYQAYDGKNALQLVKKFNNLSLAIVDYKIPKLNGVELIAQLKKQFPSLPVILITAFGFEKLGMGEIDYAFDYLVKPFDMERLRESVRFAIEASELLKMSKEISVKDNFCGLVGSSPSMINVYQHIEKVAHTDFTVLITGESGTGKELCARAIHERSHRRKGPFISVSCSAVPETLLEAELFGYEKGAFTGAVKAKAGKFELAENGTIFLDEIGDMSLFTQSKILRVLQEKEVERLGALRPIKVNARVIAATNKNLIELVKKGYFREDLYYRLNVFNIHMPALRERKEDIPLLVEHFLKKYSLAGKEIKNISIETLEFFLKYNWPGNVRELENFIQRAIVMVEDDTLRVDHLKFISSCGLASPHDGKQFEMKESDDLIPLEQAVSEAVAEVEKKLIRRALQICKGNRTKAASLLKISRRNLHNKIKKYGLDNR